MLHDRVNNYLCKLHGVLDTIHESEYLAVLSQLHQAIDRGFKVFLIGNGGSSSTASHMANDLGKLVSTASGRKVKAMSLTADVAVLTTWANDVDYGRIFVEQLENWAVPGDLLIAFSGSGNSGNILEAVQYCGYHGIITIGMTGMGGELAKRAGFSLVVASTSMQQIEDTHLILSHMLCLELAEMLKNGDD
jgi:D-sedoheptulose 7-phosphate isomerase